MRDVFIEAFRKRWKIGSGYLICLMISSYISMMLPKAIEEIQKANKETVFQIVGYWTIIFTAGSIVGYYRKVFVEDLEVYVMVTAKRRFFSEIFNKNMKFFNKNHSGRLALLINKDIKDISNSLTLQIAMVLRGLTYCIISILVLLYNNVALLVLGSGPLFIFIYIGRSIAASIRKKKFHLSKLNGKFSAFTTEVFRQIRTVKLFSAEKLESEKYSRLMEEIALADIDLTKSFSLFLTAIMLVVEVLILVALGLWVYVKHYHPYIHLEDLATSGIYVVYCGVGFRIILSGYSEIQKSFGLFDGLNEIYQSLEREITIESFKSSISLPEIKIENLFFSYNSSEEIIKGISLSINKGEICAIVGESGNGKTTLFNLLTFLYKPTSGQILIDGTNIFDHQPSWARQHYGVVTQEGLLFTGTILENIVYAYKNDLSDLAEINEICDTVGISELIRSLPEGVHTKVGENGLSLSGGQRQRICIGRALIRKPKILLLDEATSGLDKASEMKIQNVIEKAVRDRKYTVIMITHRVSSLRGLADRIFFISSGMIRKQGTFDQLMGDQDFALLTKV